MRTDEIALVKVAVKRAKKKNSVYEGLKAINRWKKNHPNRILDDILHCYRKVIKRGIIKDDVIYDYFNTVRIHFSTYRNDEFSPCRIVNYEIPVTCLQNYLLEIEDCRTAAEFFETYDSDEAQELYTYAEDDNRILKESVDYSDDFIQEYEKSNYLSREDFFWSVYIKQSA